MSGLSELGRSRLALVADALIPAGEDMPSASAVDVHGKGVDRVLRERPDLEGAVQAAAAADVTDAAGALAWVRQLADTDQATFDALLETVAGAFFLDPDVGDRLGYRRREALPIVFDTDLDELTAPVLARGTIYREA